MSVIGLEFQRDTSAFTECEPLVRALRAGDSCALADAYDLHHIAVRAFVQRLLGDRQAAEDLLQEVFVKLPRTVSNLRPPMALRTFLIAVAANEAKHFIRAAVRRRRVASRFEEASQWAPAATENPEERSIRLQRAEALSRALDALPLEQRIAFVLCEVEGRSSTEVCEILQVPAATARTRLFHAKRKLREQLAREDVR